MSQSCSPKKKRQQCFTTDTFSSTLNQQKRPLNIQQNLYLLTAFEKKEIAKFTEVYYIGTKESKDRRNMQGLLAKKANNGFDSDSGYYKVVVGDHLNYRYEVLQELDRGAFGQVVRCLDHKDQKEVAVKLNRNSSYDHSSSRTEIAILKKLKNGIQIQS